MSYFRSHLDNCLRVSGEKGERAGILDIDGYKGERGLPGLPGLNGIPGSPGEDGNYRMSQLSHDVTGLRYLMFLLSSPFLGFTFCRSIF